MVCADELSVTCIVRDMSRISQSPYEVLLPASASVRELVDKVANKMQYELHSFKLSLQSTSGSEKVFTSSNSKSLAEAGFSTDPGTRNLLILEGIRGVDSLVPIPEVVAGSENEADQSFPALASQTTIYPLPPPPSTLLPPASSPAGDFTYTSPLSRHDTGYVGLVNQAMTCYLNSLLQALYMTPEFRNALYKWKFDSGHNTNASKCIPFQLQKLFLNLQTSNRTAVETTELTRSFGWVSGEVWQQHDIQELCRVMFDALEHEFKETEQADLINQLYQGMMIDYVKCLECGREKSREDTFLDIPLPVRPFGVPKAYKNIKDALSAFVQPETLEGNNQYFCESCNKKCDAHKGLKFSRFPYLLTLHLKRFDFDYSTMHRIKLNDRVSFPEVLDLNSFVRWTTGEIEEEDEDDESPVRGDDSSTGDSVLDEETSHSLDNQIIDQAQDEDEGIDMSINSSNHTECERNKEPSKGPFVYQLYSIMIHSGSASGGHYYAYIKDFAKDEWFCFNDQSVTRITESDIEKTYGGGPSRHYYSGSNRSSTNAYMLMYRQIDKDRNASAITEEQFPQHIKDLLEEIRRSEEKEREMRAREEEMIKLKVYTGANVSNCLGQRQEMVKIHCHNETPFSDVLQMAYQNLQLDKTCPIEHCRLVSYSHSQDQMEVSFEGREKESISSIVASLQKCLTYEFFLETKEKDQVFRRYCSGDINMSVYRIDPEKEEVYSFHNIRTTPHQCLNSLKLLICKVIPSMSRDMHMVISKHPILSYLADETQALNKLGFYSTNRLFICPKGSEPEITPTNFQSSKLYKFIDKVQNIIILDVLLPDNSQDTLERLLIPSLNEGKLNGNNNRQCDVTPTEGRDITVPIPMPNGIEDEGLCSSGAGGTSDQSTSEDSSLTDSERTIIGDVPNEGQSSPSDSEQQLSSPESQHPVKIVEVNGDMVENWDDIYNKYNYFKATSHGTKLDGTKILRVVVDRNMDMTTFKSKLEPFVGVAAKYMKLYRGPDHGGELMNSFSTFKDEECVSIKLYRFLSDGEYRIKLFLLNINSNPPVDFFCDWIVSRDETIAVSKKSILNELEKRRDIRIPYEKCRLWKKNWKHQSPGQLLIESQTWDDEICGTTKDVFVQESEAEGDGITIFTKQWHPSTLSFDLFKEINFQGTPVDELRDKISEISGIPSDLLMFAKGVSPFPCDNMSVLNIHNELDWTQNPKYLPDEDGIVLFYRDVREQLKTLTKEEQLDLSNKESKRLNGSSSNQSGYVGSYSSPRKEKGLKIYLNTNNSPRQTRSYIDID